MSELKLKGIKNARDFSNIVNSEGLSISPLRFIRSARLSDATQSDARFLLDRCHLSDVIDLRTAEERAERPDITLPGVQNTHIPLFEESTLGVTRERGLKAKNMLSSLPSMSRLYSHIVTDEFSIAGLKREFEIILSHTGKAAVLWHCSEGKDRCGLTSALFLSLLDVDRDSILADYLLTNKTAMKKANGFFALVLLVGGGFSKAKEVRNIFSADAEFLLSAFSAIDENYGSVDGFIKNALKISESEKRDFKKLVLTEE